jgi:uncharacterized protein YijF (DUF1287 family)
MYYVRATFDRLSVLDLSHNLSQADVPECEHQISNVADQQNDSNLKYSNQRTRLRYPNDYITP